MDTGDNGAAWALIIAIVVLLVIAGFCGGFTAGMHSWKRKRG